MRSAAKRLLPVLFCLGLLCACDRAPIDVPPAGNTGRRAAAQTEAASEAQPNPLLTLTINGEPFTLPMTLAQLETRGYTAELFNGESEDAYASAMPAGTLAELSGNGVTFKGRFANGGDIAHPVALTPDAPLTWAHFDAEGQTARIELAGGLVLGEMSVQDVLDLYGSSLDASGTPDKLVEMLYGEVQDGLLCVVTDEEKERVVAVELLSFSSGEAGL